MPTRTTSQGVASLVGSWWVLGGLGKGSVSSFVAGWGCEVCGTDL